jgi:ABC-type nitrate/sulfonate/bicarbonate transport system substrate-binding protein
LATLAERLGFNERRGVTVHTVATPSSDAQLETLSRGENDLAVTSSDNLMIWNLKATPGDFVLVAQVEKTTPLSLVARPGITAIRELKGAELLVDAPTNGFVVALMALLAEEGLQPDAYTMNPVGGVVARMENLIAGVGAATLLGFPFTQSAIKAGCVELESVNVRYPSYPGQGAAVRKGAFTQKGDSIRAWLQALEDARIWLPDHGPDAQSLLADAGVPAPAVAAMLANVPSTLVPDRPGLELVIAQRHSLELPGGDVNYEDLTDLSLLS